MLISRRSRWLTPPQYWAGLDLHNRLTDGLVDVIRPSQPFSYLNGIAPSKVGTVNYTYGAPGLGAQMASGNNGLVYAGAWGRVPSPLTLMVLYEMVALPGGSARVVSNFVSTSYGFSILPTSTNFRAGMAGLGVNTILTGSSSATGWLGRPRVEVFIIDGTSNPRSAAFYENGKRTATGSGNYLLPASDFRIGYDGSGASLPCRVYLTAIWERILNDAEIYALSENPWQLFRPLPQRIWVPVGGGATAYTLTCQTGQFSVSGKSADLKRDAVVSPASGTFSLSGKSASLLKGSSIAPAAGVFSLSGKSAGLSRGLRLQSNTGVFSLTGNSAILTKESALGNYTLSALNGAFALSGKSAGLLYGRNLAVSKGTFSLTGYAASIARGFPLAAQSGAFVLSGSPASLLLGRVLTAERGVFTLSGKDAILIYVPGLGPVFVQNMGATMLDLNTAASVTVFMRSTADHMTPVTGLALQVFLSKNGSAFSPVTRTVTEVGNGVYKITLEPQDTDTTGDLWLRCAAGGADDTMLVTQVMPLRIQIDELYEFLALKAGVPVQTTTVRQGSAAVGVTISEIANGVILVRE